MSYSITRLPNGAPRDIVTEYESALVILESQRRDLEARMVERLDDLTDDDLYELAGRCTREDSWSDHCLYCEAWSLYVDRQEDGKKEPR